MTHWCGQCRFLYAIVFIYLFLGLENKILLLIKCSIIRIDLIRRRSFTFCMRHGFFSHQIDYTLDSMEQELFIFMFLFKQFMNTVTIFFFFFKRKV